MTSYLEYFDLSASVRLSYSVSWAGEAVNLWLELVAWVERLSRHLVGLVTDRMTKSLSVVVEQVLERGLSCCLIRIKRIFRSGQHWLIS